jgi:hypothetical protein
VPYVCIREADRARRRRVALTEGSDSFIELVKDHPCGDYPLRLVSEDDLAHYSPVYNSQYSRNEADGKIFAVR